MNASHYLVFPDAIGREAPPEILAAWRRAQKHALFEWNNADAAGADALRKAGLSRAVGLRQQGERLLVPMLDPLGELWAVQYLPPGFTPGRIGSAQPTYPLHARMHGLHHWVGPAVNREALDVFIGVTVHLHDAERWHDEIGIPVLVAFEPSNLVALAGMLRASFPATRIGLWSRWPEHEPAMHEAAAATGALAVLECEGFADAQRGR